MITTTIQKTPIKLRTDRFGVVFPGDVVVEVGVVSGAADLQFLSDDTHILVCLQEDVRRETEL